MSDTPIEINDDSDQDVQLLEVRQKETSKIYQGSQGTNTSQHDLAIPTPPSPSRKPPHRFRIPLHSDRPKPQHGTAITTAIDEETEDETESEPAPAPTVTLTNKSNTLPYPHNLPTAHNHPTATGHPPLRAFRPIPPSPTPSQPNNHHPYPTNHPPPPPPPPPPGPASPERPSEPHYHPRTHFAGYVGYWNDRTGRGLLVDTRRPCQPGHMVGLREIAVAGYGALVAGSLLEWEYDEGVVRKVWVYGGCDVVLYKDAWNDKIKYPYMYLEREEGYTPEIR